MQWQQSFASLRWETHETDIFQKIFSGGVLLVVVTRSQQAAISLDCDAQVDVYLGP